MAMKFKNLFRTIFGANILCFLCFFLNVNISGLYAQKRITEVIKDASFHNGLLLSPLDPATVRKGGGFAKTFRDTLRFNKSTSNPSWRLHQWHSKYSLEKSDPVKAADGRISYENRGKRVALLKDSSLLLEIKTSNEWGNTPRKKGEDWPHLLIAQDFSESSPVIGELEQLVFSAEIKLEKCENKMADGSFDPNLHTAHTPLYFVVRNDNSKSADYGQRIWLGIHSFDYRYPELKHDDRLRKDKGTSSYIYNIPPREFWGDVNFNDLKEHKGHADLLPYIKKAVEVMREKDLFKNPSLDDLKVTGMNFGWEVPGIFDATVSVKKLSLKAVRK